MVRVRCPLICHQPSGDGEWGRCQKREPDWYLVKLSRPPRERGRIERLLEARDVHPVLTRCAWTRCDRESEAAQIVHQEALGMKTFVESTSKRDCLRLVRRLLQTDQQTFFIGIGQCGAVARYVPLQSRRKIVHDSGYVGNRQGADRCPWCGGGDGRRRRQRRPRCRRRRRHRRLSRQQSRGRRVLRRGCRQFGGGRLSRRCARRCRRTKVQD